MISNIDCEIFQEGPGKTWETDFLKSDFLGNSAVLFSNILDQRFQ